MAAKSQIKNQSLPIPKTIIAAARFLQAISPKLAALFAAKLFTTPLKHKIPKREIHIDKESQQSKLYIPSIKKEIVVYQYGTGIKKILLVHGWSGRGTQLVKIADELVALGYTTISFDAPAHGKSSGKTTLMPEFIASILALEKQFGPFEFAIGHSLGGMSVLNAVKQGLKIKKAVIIGSGDIIQDIIDDFIKKLRLKPQIGQLLKSHFEAKTQEDMEDYASHHAAKSVTIPVLIIHDKNDEDVPVKAAHNIQAHIKNSELMVTEGLGHRKILGNDKVLHAINNFLHKQ
ncbi:alpha/beta hydrolase [Flavobacterium silvisoli]|uniref:Alpha/beta hydrolase n=1 Tax=Flavobacterium silvisoli TaxID=2529433 RepID=A0A4Q9Z4H4_9FLAO|nr:alpha/beta hydrolase [Flavobacterium silvisoli]TBX68806.1 alpha/beta hydrolase [Flavobacterium silvisoli]